MADQASPPAAQASPHGQSTQAVIEPSQPSGLAAQMDKILRTTELVLLIHDLCGVHQFDGDYTAQLAQSAWTIISAHRPTVFEIIYLGYDHVGPRNQVIYPTAVWGHPRLKSLHESASK